MSFKFIGVVIKTCGDCPHSVCNIVVNSNVKLCKKSHLKKLADSLDELQKIPIPSWCPLKSASKEQIKNLLTGRIIY